MIEPGMSVTQAQCEANEGKMRTLPTNVRKVLIYRLGSIGDTAVALPAFRLIARAFPNAERRVLTNFPEEAKEAPLESVLEGTGLVNAYMRYPLRIRHIAELREVRCLIRAWRPDLLVYLAEPRGRLKAVRDMLFFRLCGIREMVGVPLTAESQEHRQLDGDRSYESEASRLARCINALGDARLSEGASWDLSLTADEFRKAGDVLAKWNEHRPYVTASVGAKVETKDWGVDNWRALFGRVASLYPKLGLVMIGAAPDSDASENAAELWRGPVLNTCGRLSPRESAALIKRSVLFMGHDSGPMHLAAAVGVRSTVVFSARNKPGVWFPFGANNQVIYHQTQCFGCELTKCQIHQKKCIRSIGVDEVYGAVVDALKDQLS